MIERPIIFSGESVRAIIEGRKTQTRRVVKPQPTCFRAGSRPDVVIDNGEFWLRDWDFGIKRSWQVGPCPYGVPGDRLWVREAWELLDHEGDERVQIAYTGDDIGGLSAAVWVTAPKWWIYAKGVNEDGKPLRKHGPQSPLFMPRWASRILLELTDVRVQRVQEIGSEDCVAEGIEWEFRGHPISGLQHAYAAMWDSLNARRGFSWADDPWVWALAFHVLEGGKA